ncbi:MAG TPA: aminotransferase class I/II-fold pyridoxal phosphate-dependent enzyme [Deltaproteobacteria bacterium]|nr:aminotransferase class I/II-fold pyridoxal phosphate-dependent enzyme [Deltaproteobacteria bacterium]
MRPSATLAIQERCRVLEAEGRSVCRLGLGQSPFPVPERVVAALIAHAHEKDYLPVRGLPALRQAVAAHHRRTQGLQIEAEDVLIGPGSKELLFGLQLAYDAELILPAPSWVSYAPQARLLGRRVRWIPTDPEQGWRLQPEALAAAWPVGRGPGLLVLNSPNNPVGHSYDAEHLAAIAAVARERGLLVLSDEIYGALHHQGGHATIAAAYPEGTLISSGLSKWCGAGGWRLGTLAGPPQLRWLLDAMAVVASETYTSVSAPIQHAAVVAYTDHPDLRSYLHRSRLVLRALGGWAAGRLRGAGCRCPEPEGAFYLLCDLSPALGSAPISGARLCTSLLDELQIAVLPGSDFGLPPSDPVIRIALVDFDGAAALAAAHDGPIDEAFLRRHCGRVVEGIERLVGWLRAGG